MDRKFTETNDAPGYHISDIPKGTFGNESKIVEECAEFIDALDQDCKIMALVELADLVGAIEGYLHENFEGIELHDLQKMSKITKRAFENGHRT